MADLSDNCLLAVPIHVATQGVLDDTLGVALLGWIIRYETDVVVPGEPSVPGGNVGALITEPRREWWVRENKNDPLFGPLSFRDADKHARFLSQVEEKSGLAEVVTFLGTRGGDPSSCDPSTLFVAFLYIEGKRTLGGRMAQFHSDRELPPT